MEEFPLPYLELASALVLRITTLALFQEGRRRLAGQWDIPSIDELEQQTKAASRQTIPIENVQGTSLSPVIPTNCCPSPTG
jgi:hypothetical protein